RAAGRRGAPADPGGVAPAFRFGRLGSSGEVEAFEQPPMGAPGRYVWAWLDEAAGEGPSRCFPTDFGIAEGEATGLAAVMLGGQLRRPLTIRQGVGSEIMVRPRPDG